MTRIGNEWESWNMILSEIIEDQKKNRQDYMILMVGPEGGGKSNGMLNTITKIAELRGVTPNINCIGGNLKGFFKSLHNNPRDGIHVLDEGKELIGINAGSKIVKKFNELITTIREMGNIYIICFRNPFVMGSYVRDEKCFVIMVYWYEGTKENRTYFCAAFRRNDFNMIVEEFNKGNQPKTIRKLVGTKRYRFICKPPLYQGELLVPYKDLKRNMQVDTINEIYEEFVGQPEADAMAQSLSPGELYYTAKQARTLMGCSASKILQMADNGKIRSVRLPGSHHRRYLKEDVNNFSVAYGLGGNQADSVANSKNLLLPKEEIE